MADEFDDAVLGPAPPCTIEVSATKGGGNAEKLTVQMPFAADLRTLYK